MKGIFISVEGTDGSGKSTQLDVLEKYLRDKRHRVLRLREPGGSVVGESVRDILLSPHYHTMVGRSEALLYAAARAQLVEEVILPALERGETVVCDRYVDSSYVYQGFGRGMNLEEIISINRFATAGLMPDITLFLDLSPEMALRRRISATGADRIEQMGQSFQEKVYEGYQALLERFPDRIRRVDADGGIETVSRRMLEQLDIFLATRQQ